MPLIRSGVLDPIVSWMSANGVEVDKALADVGLNWVARGSLTDPMPLLPVTELLSLLAAEKGPDVPRRIVAAQTTLDLGPISAFIALAGSPANALRAAPGFLPYHNSHELLSAEETPTTLRLTSGWFLRFTDRTTLHMVHQFFVSVIARICSDTMRPDPWFLEIAMLPHPNHGLDHLRPWLGDRVHATEEKSLTIVLDRAAAEQPFSITAPSAPLAFDLGTLEKLSGKTLLSDSVATLVKAMLPYTKPRIDQIAGYAQRSRRSFQRQLSEEGTTFSEIVDAVRLELAKDYMETNTLTQKEITDLLGFARPETLSRALRRWRHT
jgi:AraC-like DNA-binding protein